MMSSCYVIENHGTLPTKPEDELALPVGPLKASEKGIDLRSNFCCPAFAIGAPAKKSIAQLGLKIGWRMSS